ncbi:MAG TPA: carbamoyltransferase HypF [Verrucomicrobiae bacterium]|nr:carbamoyltransferase HypF [Verrucomicrobiae bacterium]
MTFNSAEPCARLRLIVRGAVQGVGFRPFVYRLANELGLTGWVNNGSEGVTIEVEGARTRIENFRIRLAAEKPPRSFIQGSEATWLDPAGYDGFTIRDSASAGSKTALVLPDIATCPDCLREIFDPINRRHRYPFTNCTNCGPRFSIIEKLPYDRANTSMRGFPMCPACQAEYDDPNDRRFHAQPNACPVCGPQLELWPGATNLAPVSIFGREVRDSRDACPTVERPRPLAHGNDALLATAHVIRCGQIVAVKGVGGFHLFVDARNEEAVRRLRERKHREEKPLALMFPTLASVKEVSEVSLREEQLLGSPEAPIVLLRRIVNGKWQIADEVAPNNPNLGVMLPSNPLHHLLMAELGFPVVATSGNLSDEPICTDEFEALERLRGIADVLLVHNRPIVRHVDDSIVRVTAGREMVLRRARGYAPLPVQTRNAECGARNILSVGAHLKNSVAFAVGEQVFLSQHIGDLETEQAHDAFRRVASELSALYEAEPEIVAADLHPDYLSTQFASGLAGTRRPLVRVQHHVAHVLSCLAENEIELPALGVAWDGTGLGEDGSIWGGEFFFVTDEVTERVVRLRPFPLPGGDAAVKEPRRAALGLLYQLLGDEAFQRNDVRTIAALSYAEQAALKTMLRRGLNSPLCSSVGRLFDAVASLVGLRQLMRFEGQAAMELEFALTGTRTDEAYSLPLITLHSPMILDWSSLVEGILFDVNRGVSVGEIAAKFHNGLAETIVSVAREFGCERVALSGGCFQNRYLTERAVARLRAEGFQPYWHQRVPTNDGGIALGQVVAARRWAHGKAARDAKENLSVLDSLRPLRPLCEV